MRFPVPLQIRITLLLFVFGLAAIGIELGVEIYLESSAHDNDMRTRVKNYGERAAGLAQYFSGKGDLDGENLALSLFSTIEDMQLAALCDSRDRILVATEYRWREHSLTESPLAESLPLATRARETMQGQIALSADGRTMLGAFPFLQNSSSPTLQAGGIGVAVLQFDMTESAARAKNDSLQEIRIVAPLLVLLCLGFWWVLHRTLTQRVRLLVEATQRIAQGETAGVIRLAPGDELGEIAAAIDAMSGELRRSTNSLRESEKRWRLALDAAGMGTWEWDFAADKALLGERARHLLNAPETGPIASLLERLLPEDRDHVQSRLRKAIETNTDFNVTFRVLPPEGNARWVEAVGRVMRSEDDGQEKIIGVVRDITTRQESAQLLIQQGRLLNQAQEAIMAIDTTDRIVFWNRGAEELYGWSSDEALGRDFRELLYPDDPAALEEIRRPLLQKGDWSGEQRQFAKSRRAITVESRFTVVRDEGDPLQSTLIISTDITEKKRLEAQVLRSQRMESIGTLAGGIAHDLNNVLSPITMGVQMLQMRYTDEFSQKMLGVMATNAERGAALIKQILSFARGVGGERIPVSPQHLVKEIIKMMRETFPKEITIQQRLGEDPWAINGDPTQLHQVLMNLCVNARDAMPRGGVLTIGVDNLRQDELSALMDSGLPAGHYVQITVADTGQGIAREHLDRIFDPFFTTKEPGKGTGLGLATVYGIVKTHGGFIHVQSEPGQGTCFKICFPGLRAPNDGNDAASRPTAPVGHGELLLLVDDEAAIREMTRSVLEAFGYRVLTAEDGVDAIQLYARHKDEIRLVITDMVMPVMDGPTMVRTLRNLSPDILVIGSSGLAGESKAAEARQLGVHPILAKPYNADTLLGAVADALRG